MKKTNSLLVLLLFSLFTWAQQKQLTEVCGTRPESTDFLRKIPPGQMKQQSAGLHLMRMFIHIGRNTNGTNRAMFEPDIETELAFSNSVFSMGNICYALVGFDFVDNDEVNTNAYEQPEATFTPYMKPGCFNVFVVASIKGDTIIGFSPSTPANYMITKKDGFGLRRTFIHEMGHAMGLHHTFRGYGKEAGYICKELVNGSNGTTCGDEVQGTPADPYGEKGATAAACTYNGTVKDANNQLFAPATNNYMSYWANFNCNRTAFSNDQYTKMATTIDNNASLTSFLAPETLLLIDNTASSGYLMLAASGYIVAQNSYLLKGTSKTYITAPVVSLKPGFTASPGYDGYVRILPTTCQ
jgi:hypothetical protein